MALISKRFGYSSFAGRNMLTNKVNCKRINHRVRKTQLAKLRTLEKLAVQKLWMKKCMGAI